MFVSTGIVLALRADLSRDAESIMILHENSWPGTLPWFVDRLPHDARRRLFQIRRPAEWAHLQAMRKEGGLDPIFDLSSLLKHNAIFVHVPKAAGRSVRKGLFGGRTASHTTLHNYRLAFSRAEYSRMFKFGFVRNPWDRCFSAYNFIMAGGATKWDLVYRERLARYADFEEFVLTGLNEESIRNIVLFLPACHFLEVRPGLMPLDFLGYYEQFQEDFSYIAKRMKQPVGSVPWENKSSYQNLDYRTVYTPAMIERTAEVYARDIDLFGYSFNGYNPHPFNKK
jgi:hypothetical protein